MIKEKLKDRIQSGRHMERIIKTYSDDISPLDDLSLNEYFDFIKKIPYQEDGQNEMLDRPKELLNPKKWPGLDCKKKAILMASYLQKRGLKWALVAVCEKLGDDIHHVYTLLKNGTRFYPLDPTFSTAKFLKINRPYKAEIIGSNYK